MNVKEISIVIVTHNSEKDIYDCLSSIFAYNDIGSALEVIVVDNNSNDFPSMKNRICRTYEDRVRVLANDTNGGYGQGNNVGIQIATAPIVAIMNPDVRLTMPLFQDVLKTLQPLHAIMCGGMQYYAPSQKACSYYPVYTLPPFTRFLLHYFGMKRNTYLYKYMWLQGAFFFIKRKEFMSIGGFDEHIFMYGEEFDIHERLLKAYPQAKFHFLKHCKYIHLAGEREFSPAQYEAQLRSLLYIMTKGGHSPLSFLRKEKLFTIIAYRFTNFANYLHHRDKRLPLNTALEVINRLILEYSSISTQTI